MKRKRLFMISAILCALALFAFLTDALAQDTDYGPDMDWFSAEAGENAPVPDGLSEGEAEIYRAAYAAGHYAALHPVHIEGMFVLNKRTKKFHYSECPNTLLIDSSNRENYFGKKEDVLAMGYQPCGSCKP